MADPRVHHPVQLIVACFSRHLEALAWAAEQLVQRYGPVALTSEDFQFNQTRYYEETMGTDLLKRFLVFQRLMPADCLPEVKLITNALEDELSQKGRFTEPRPLNLDPGTLELGKFLLATTKDQGHRIYLNQGIFAEVTLRFEAGEYVPWPWTYADYRQDCVRSFLKQARELYRQQLDAIGGVLIREGEAPAEPRKQARQEPRPPKSERCPATEQPPA